MPANLRLYILTGVVVGLVLLTAAAATWHISSIKERRDRIQDLKSHRTELHQAVEQQDHIRDELHQLKSLAEDFKSRVPEEARIAPLLERLGNDLREQETSRRQMVTGDNRITEELGRTELELKFESSFESFFAIMERIERYDRLVRPDEIWLSRDFQDQPGPVMVEMTLSTFFVPESER